jgi:hypothetical protein
MFQTHFVFRNTMQRHEYNNQSASKAKQISSPFLWKREGKQIDERLTPEFGVY